MKKVYKYQLQNSDIIIFEKCFLNKSFKNEWIQIIPTGIIKISKGYAWNGCSPKINILNLCIGTPDGALNPKTMLPYTYYASLVHDALYQFKKDVPVTRLEADKIFYNQCGDFFWKKVYYYMIRTFGWICGK